MGANQRDESKWPKCLFWIAKCSRFCSGERAPNSKYCVNHLHVESAPGEKPAESQRKRVVCPIDPSHTVFEDRLEKHIHVCNKHKSEDAKSACPYFVPNLNCGNNTSPQSIAFSTPDEVSSLRDCDAQKKAFELALEQKIRSVYKSLFPDGIPTSILRPSRFEPFIADKATKGATQESLRHLYQQVSMICNMENWWELKGTLTISGLMQSDPVYVEFGAGRGMLSLGIDYALNGKLPNEERPADFQDRGKYLLIDMSPVRFKADRWMRHKEGDFFRVTGNIRDIDLRRVPIFESERNRQFVGIAKHLCGVATDYTIRCILNCIQEGKDCHGLNV